VLVKTDDSLHPERLVIIAAALATRLRSLNSPPRTAESFIDVDRGEAKFSIIIGAW
jgi:hypothetical protein